MTDAEIEAEVETIEVYCNDCGSCGIGGCCPRYCPRCRNRHDEAEEREDAQGIGEGPL